MTVPAPVATLKLHGMMNTDASPAFRHALRSLLLRPYTSSAATPPSGSPAFSSRPSWTAASSGLVANSRSSGIPAARHFLRPPVRHVHVEIGPGLPAGGDVGGEHAGHAVLHRVRDPGVLRCRARREVPGLDVRGLVDRQPRPDQVVFVAGKPRLKIGRASCRERV